MKNEKVKCGKCGKEFIKHQKEHIVDYVSENTIWCETDGCIFNHIRCDKDDK